MIIICHIYRGLKTDLKQILVSSSISVPGDYPGTPEIDLRTFGHPWSLKKSFCILRFENNKSSARTKQNLA